MPPKTRPSESLKTWGGTSTRLARLLSECLYRLKVWVKGERPAKLDEAGVTSRDNTHVRPNTGRLRLRGRGEQLHTSVRGRRAEASAASRSRRAHHRRQAFFRYAKHYFRH